MSSVCLIMARQVFFLGWWFMKVGPADLQRLAEENKALLQENQHLYDQITLYARMQETALILTAGGSLERILAYAAQAATEMLHARTCRLFTIDEPAREMVLQVVHGRNDGVASVVRFGLNKGIAGWVATQGKPLLLEDAVNDRRYAAAIDGPLSAGSGSTICAPLVVKGKTTGVIEASECLNGCFSQYELDGLATLARQTAIGVENARLLQLLSEEKNRLLVLQEEMRKKLARDLHDGPAQALAAIAMNIDYVKKMVLNNAEGVVEELESLRLLSTRTMRDVRNLLFELRPLILESQGLVPTLQSMLSRLEESEGIHMNLNSDGSVDRLERKLETTVFAIVQEAVNNVRKHGGAQNIWVDIASRNGVLSVGVADDGRGFDLKRVQTNYVESGSFGLLNMRERASLVGGTLNIISAPGKGTTVSLQIPLG